MPSVTVMDSVAAPGADAVERMPSSCDALSSSHIARAQASAISCGDISAALEDGFALFEKGRDALGIIVGHAGLALRIALDVEMGVE